MASLKYKIPSVVQFMVDRGCARSEDFRAMLIEAMDMSRSNTQLDDEKVMRVVQQTNKRLEPFKLKIRPMVDEGTPNSYYVLISTVDNEITRAASHYTPKQFELFRLTLQAISGAQEGMITEKEFKKLAEKALISTTTKTRSSTPEHKLILDEWCRKHWLAYVNQGDIDLIRLGVRSKAELDVLEGVGESSA